jgi:hypothetical protein
LAGLATCWPTGTVGPVDVRIVGFDLPGRSFGTPDCACRNIRVGIQRKAEVVDLLPGGWAEAVWDFGMQVVDVGTGVDFRGLTGRGGGPLCAAVRPPTIDWAVVPA